MSNQLLHVLLGWVQSIGTEGTFHATKGVFLLSTTAHEHESTNNDQKKNGSKNHDHGGIKSAGNIIAAVVSLGVIRPLTGGWVVGPISTPLAISVGVKNEFAAGFNRLWVGFQTLAGRKVQFNPLDGDPSLVGVIALVVLDVDALSAGLGRVQSTHVKGDVEAVTVAQRCALIPEVLEAQVVLHDGGSGEVLLEESRLDVDFACLSARKNASRNGEGVFLVLRGVQLNVVPLDGWLFITEALGHDDEVHSVLFRELACTVVNNQFNSNLVLSGTG